MPRRRVPSTSIPYRPDRRRPSSNATDAQRLPRRGRRGQLEAIAERRMRAFELRKAGASYREIAKQLDVDVHTIHGDLQAEMVAIHQQTAEQADELRALELARLDGMTSGLWPQVREGIAPAVSAAVRVSERRAKLLGLDAPTTSKTEVTGSLGVYAERLAAERELFAMLSVEQLEELARDSEALVNKAMAMVQAQRVQPAVAMLPTAAITLDTTSDALPALDSAKSSDNADGSGAPSTSRSSIDFGDTH
jgi:hypothetical protein